MLPSMPSRRTLVLCLLPAIAFAAGADLLTGKPLASALARGGYVVLMRHASAPGAPPDPSQADPENLKHERQLDARGRDAARAMGETFRHLRIPVGEVLSSPTYRALETARLAQLPTPHSMEELGDAGTSMSPDVGGTRGAWLRSRVAQQPEPGTNSIIITHYPNISEAFASEAKDLAEGEALIFRPDGQGGASLVGRMKIEEWPRLIVEAE